MILDALHIPGLFVTGADTGVGTTVVAGAIAQWFRLRGRRVAVCKPVATGCVRRREGLVSEDAEFLAVCADARHPLDMIAPQRYGEPLVPAVAAERARQPVDWFIINNSIRLMCQDSDVIIVEGVEGIMAPIDEKHTVVDMAAALKAPAVVVGRPGPGTINHTILTVSALRGAGVPVAGVVVNRYRADQASVAEETNPRAIERWGKVPVLCIVPDETIVDAKLPAGIAAAVAPVDWASLARRGE